MTDSPEEEAALEADAFLYRADEQDYDVVIATLQKHHDVLSKMDENDFLGFGIMQQIRMQHCYELKMAMQVWQNYKKANPYQFEWE
jgi:hypothetical protein